MLEERSADIQTIQDLHNTRHHRSYIYLALGPRTAHTRLAQRMWMAGFSAAVTTEW